MYAELTGTKKCGGCKETKLKSEFTKYSTQKDGLDWICRPCKKKRRLKYAHKTYEYNRSWRENNLEYAKLRDKRSNLMKHFGLTLEEFELMKQAQNYGCAICGKNRSSKKKDLCVDHDHVTGKIRGLLCDCCNRGIGLLLDSTELLQKSIDYLKNSKK